MPIQHLMENSLLKKNLFKCSLAKPLHFI